MDNKENAKTIDQVQDLVDGLVLSLFEAMRSEPSAESCREASSKIIDKYYETCDAIDTVIGIDSTREEIIEKTRKVMAEYHQNCEKVLELEHKIIELRSQVEVELEKVRSTIPALRINWDS